MEPNIAKVKQITFYSHWLPALAPGVYSASVTSTLKVSEDGSALPTSPVTETFHVGGPRYALTGSEAYSCYPAPAQIGRFYDTLPHIVFDRCTLPWERTIDGTDPTVEHDPWLALILLTDADFSNETTVEKRVPTIITRQLQPEDTTKKSEGVLGLDPLGPVIGPTFQKDPYDSSSDFCQTIDLPARVFGAVMPHKQDLPYLAHVREVETDNKETWSLLKEGKFSVVVCNRFPETQATATGEKDWGIVNTVCLVSLEGWGEYLDERGKLDTGKTCRVLVLGSWRFTCQGSSAFKNQMKDLDDSRLLGRPPLVPKNGEGEALEYVNQALKMGFAPVNHDLRNDDTTISWYRGPLVPMSYEKSMSYADISCADAALRYEPETGMFDASYAAAWQLGRLLAMQDQAFAQALYRFRTDYQRWVRTTNRAALEKLGKKASDLQTSLGARSNIRDWYAEQLTTAGCLASGQSAASVQPPDPPPIPATVQNWLGQAMLLYGVPFFYLVPDGEMLPAESIRFFYLNPEWINCLLQGACSVGRCSQTDELADQLLRARFFEVSEKLASELRSGAKRAADRRRGGTEEDDTPVMPPVDQPGGQPETVLHWPLSGFLLRSAAVETWIGLEAKATGVDSTGLLLDPLQILRMDRLAPDILLCIYNGKVTEIEVKQPPEAIHFGAASKTTNGHEKTGLRKIKGDTQTMGDMCEGTNTVDVPSHGERVVNAAELAANLKQELKEKGQIDDGDSFTSAEFALEMIELPAKVTFKP